MRMTARLVLSLVVAVILVLCLYALIEMQAEKVDLGRDQERRSEVVAETLGEAAKLLVQNHAKSDLQSLVDRFTAREGLVGVIVYDPQGTALAAPASLADQLRFPPAPVVLALAQNRGAGEFLTVNQMPLYVYSVPLRDEKAVVGALAIFSDASHIQAQSGKLWRSALARVGTETLLIALISLLIVRWAVIRPVARATQWMQALRMGALSSPHPAPKDLFQPLTQEMGYFARSLLAARAAAEKEARLRDAAESLWTAERLRVHIKNKLSGSALLVVSNREPYMHVRQGKKLEPIVPASGLVTALEPVLRACDGTWIAHGAGDGDRETVDKRDHLRIPPEEPTYTLRRVWLSKEEEEGYYYGFANEGLWPLCHIAHTRPIFREADWEHYQQVNKKFAEAVLEETKEIKHPAVLVQDYHFALVPRLVKERRPDARVAIYWHIPWPNPEAFGICPWQRELLDGLLGADLVGFHIQAHCTNFLETVDAALESRIEWERFAVNRRDHLTLVRPFPISVAFPETEAKPRPPTAPLVGRSALFRELGVEATLMAVGVDRVDYTKGIPERLRGLERFLDKWPAYRGRLTFVQIAAPSRTRIKRYQTLAEEIEAEVNRINSRFQAGKWKPIVFLNRHHNHEEIERYYRAADVCLVTSLHDGMNLVAKEFVAAREDEQGVLILSCFTGASRELRDALAVNPYDAERLGEAIRIALEMEPQEMKNRMRRMRSSVKEHNVYRWAGNLTAALAEVRLEMPAQSGTS